MPRIKLKKWTQDQLEWFVFDSVCEGQCMKCGELADCCEPDAADNYCEMCCSNTVKSALIIHGIM